MAGLFVTRQRLCVVVVSFLFIYLLTRTRERESVSWTFCCDYTEHTSRTHHMCAMHWLASCLKRVLRVVFISGRLSCQSICVLHVHVCVFFPSSSSSVSASLVLWDTFDLSSLAGVNWSFMIEMSSLENHTIWRQFYQLCLVKWIDKPFWLLPLHLTSRLYFDILNHYFISVAETLNQLQQRVNNLILIDVRILLITHVGYFLVKSASI